MKIEVKSKLLFNFFVVFCLLQVQNLSAQSISINADSTFQIIRGFGGMNYVTWGIELNESDKELAFGNEPGEMGLSILRIPVPPDVNSFSRELPTASYAAQKGVTVIASPWNAPSNMIEELNSNDNRLLPEFYSDYVNHLNSFVSYMDNNGVPLYAISVQNEPDWHGWTTWTSNEMFTFVKEYAQDINCRVISPESFSYRRQMTDPLLNDSVANSHIDILGTHLYGTSKSNYYYPLAYQKNKEIWMTEHLLGSEDPEPDSWSLAMELADELNTCMDANFSAFIYWYIHRFYGLINNEGNITNKGYVMEQFAKFIRPGAHRVYADFKAVSKVNTTAFKTDSSLVIVVVNQNNSAVNLNFNIENNIIGVDSLTKFTTTETKRVVNEGTFVLNEGNFSASVDPGSVTTFTSLMTLGGKYGNIPPVAFAGNDQEILDTLGTALSLTLKGSESTDTDGEIVKYSWAKDGYQISTLPDLDVLLDIGNHSYVLTVTDDDGSTDSDTINITVYSNNSSEIWLEAECTQVGSNWNNLSNSNASNGKYLTVKPGVEAKSNPSTDMNDYLVYNFYVPESGNYKIWGRVLAPSADDDSYWVKVDNDAWTLWNGIVGSSSWQWDDVHDQSNENPMVYALDTGYHNLSICYREDGAAIDKFYITNTGQIPTEFGEDATNCDTNTNSIYIEENSNSVNVYPNPVKSTLNIESVKPFDELIIYNSYGSVIWHKTYPGNLYSAKIQLNFESGIYTLRINRNSLSTITKFIIAK